MTYALGGKRVYVAGHRGMVGAALVRRLAREDCEVLVASRDQVDLRDPGQVSAWMSANRPDAIFIAAAKVGGIFANDSFPADFLHDNLMIEANLFRAGLNSNVEKIAFLGSSCIYPKYAPQPIAEESLLTGELEPTNEAYAIAKIAGIKLGQSYRRQHGLDCISAMPTNLYGPGDNFDLQSSHVLPALVRKVVEAKRRRERHIAVWGSGEPRREFLHVDDCADACVFLMKHYSDALHINVGSGEDISIRDLALLVCRAAGVDLELRYDCSKPDGTPRKLMASTRLRDLGWAPAISLEQGVAAVVAQFEASVTA